MAFPSRTIGDDVMLLKGQGLASNCVLCLTLIKRSTVCAMAHFFFTISSLTLTIMDNHNDDPQGILQALVEKEDGSVTINHVSFILIIAPYHCFTIMITNTFRILVTTRILVSHITLTRILPPSE
jgi:hypothetical protein